MSENLISKSRLSFHNKIQNYLTKISTAVFCLSITASAALAQQTPGKLDTSFDGDGKLVVNLGNPDNVAGAVAVQPDGKIVVVGLTGAIESASTTPGSSDFVVLRYNPDGTPDNTFEGDGKVVTSFGNGEDGAGAVLIQPDGKILVAGSINTKTTAGEIALARYNADGSLDTTFDTDGKLTTDVAEGQNAEERAEAMILQPDGKILVLVSTVKENFLEDQAFVVRYNADGSRDNTFKGDGITSLGWVIPHGIAQGITGRDIALQADGKIVVAGTVLTNEGGDVFLWRINPDGSDDDTLNNFRSVTTSFNNSDIAVSVFIQPDQKILLAGSTFNNATNKNDFAFARFNSDGTLDNTFGAGGKRTTVYDQTAHTIPIRYEMQSNGKLVSVGPVITAIMVPDSSFAVTRFNADGTLDATFDGDGKAITDFGAGIDAAVALAFQKDGKIIAAGYAENGRATDNYDLAVARYFGDENAAAKGPTDFDFDGDGKADLAVYRPADEHWYIQNSGSGNFSGTRWGLASDVSIPADYDGDGKTDIAVWRLAAGKTGNEINYYIFQSSTGTLRFEQFGAEGHVPVKGDFDGDGKDDLAVFEESASNAEQNRFYYRPSSSPNENFRTIFWGAKGDRPVTGDYDGDGKTDAAVFRPSDGYWYVLQSSNEQLKAVKWGAATDKLVPADYDGDGKTDFAVFRDGVWYILQSSNLQTRYAYWGLNSDKLVPADYTGDGKADITVYRAGVWYVQKSENSELQANYFGSAEDRPVMERK
jgi:uncharacterized delta-60 repeat protein